LDRIRLNQNKLDIPVCVGMLGWDITTIGNLNKKSYGGAVLHFIAASTIIGTKFKVISYVSLEEWSDLLIGLDSQGIDISDLVDCPETIEFHIFYDSDMNFRTDKFWEKIPKNQPDIVQVLDKYTQKSKFFHLCPTTPEQDIRSLDKLRSHNLKISMQLHIFNLLKDINSYRDVLKFADYLFMNEEEAKVLSGKTNIDSVIKELRRLFQADLYITSSEKAIAITQEGFFQCPSIRIPISDPTGAGDAFAGGCTAGRILTGRHDVGLRMGTICAASKLTGYSSNSLLSMLNISI